MKHLGLVTSSYPRFPGDLAGAFVRRAALDLCRRGLRVTVVAPRDGRASRPPLDASIEVVEVTVPDRVFYGPGAPERMASQSLGWALRAPSAVLKLMESSERALRDCDALVAHWLLPAGLAVRWAAAGRRYAVVEHSSAARLLLGAGRCGALGVQGLSSGAAFVAASEPRLAARLDAFCSQGVHWLPPSTELDAFLGLETPSLRGPLQLGFLGRRVPIKGLEVLLQAFAQVRGSMRLHLAGPGQRVRAAGVVDWGALHGVEALRDFFSSIDVLVIPSRSLGSRREGFPCVLLEAWAAGRPVLASALDVLDLPLLNPGSSWRFSPGDVWGLAQRLHALASHPEQVDGEALRCRRRALAVHRYREAVSSFMLERLEVLGKRDGAAEKRDEHVLAVGA